MTQGLGKLKTKQNKPLKCGLGYYKRESTQVYHFILEECLTTMNSHSR